MNSKQHKDRIIFQIPVMPLIYSLIIPIIVLDIWVEIYHRVCFWAYGIAYVKRGNYIKIDRHKLSYLDYFEKLNCMYCGYVNGLLHYASAIAGETEKYWCGIKHKADADFQEPAHHKGFIAYGDEEAYRKL